MKSLLKKNTNTPQFSPQTFIDNILLMPKGHSEVQMSILNVVGSGWVRLGRVGVGGVSGCEAGEGVGAGCGYIGSGSGGCLYSYTWAWVQGVYVTNSASLNHRAISILAFSAVSLPWMMFL